MIKVVLKVLYGILVVAGITAVIFLYVTGKPHCLTKDKICLDYRGWSLAKAGPPYDLELTRIQPHAAQFRMVYAPTSISGSASTLAGALKQRLAKDAPAFKLIESNTVTVDKVLGIELVFDYAPQSASDTVRQAYIVVPVENHTYYFISEAAAADFTKVRPSFDKLLESVEFN